jgi:hypothetical protein
LRRPWYIPVGHLKGGGADLQQTSIDAYTKVAFAKLYDRKTPITAADLLNDRVVRFSDGHEVKLLRVLTDRGSQYCGNPERHEYELYLAAKDIDHRAPKPASHNCGFKGVDDLRAAVSIEARLAALYTWRALSAASSRASCLSDDSRSSGE